MDVAATCRSINSPSKLFAVTICDYSCVHIKLAHHHVELHVVSTNFCVHVPWCFIAVPMKLISVNEKA